MPTLLHLCDAQDIAKMIPYLVRDITHDSFQVETILTADPESTLANYVTSAPVTVVMIEYPRDIERIIQQVQAHRNLAAAKLLIITGRPSQYHALMSETVYIGDKLDRLPMLRALLAD